MVCQAASAWTQPGRRRGKVALAILERGGMAQRRVMYVRAGERLTPKGCSEKQVRTPSEQGPNIIEETGPPVFR